MAEEFEVVNRGPIVMVYTRQRNAPPIKLDAVPANPLSSFAVIVYRLLANIRKYSNVDVDEPSFFKIFFISSSLVSGFQNEA